MAQATAAAPVVDARFCAPHATAFTVAKAPGSWWWHDLAVTDAGGAAVMRVEAARHTFSRRVHLLDAATRRVVLTVRRTPSQMFTVGRRWEVFRGSGTSPADLLFGTVTRPILWPPYTRAKVHVHLAGSGGGGDPGERDPDFVVTRHGYNWRECTVSRGSVDGVDVARVKRKVALFGRVTYTVSVNAGVDHAFILALTMTLEEMSLEDSRRNN